jgi:hypothetical protein
VVTWATGTKEDVEDLVRGTLQALLQRAVMGGTKDALRRTGNWAVPDHVVAPLWNQATSLVPTQPLPVF